MKLNRILCIPVVLMMLLAVTVVPTVACPPFSLCGSEDGNNTLRFSNTTINSIGIEKGDGIQGKSLINDAINMPEVLNVGQELTKRGYQQQLEQAVPYNIIVTNNTSEKTMQLVIIPVKTRNNNLVANTMVFRMDDQTSVYAQITGTGKDFSSVLSVIKSNSSYKTHKSDLEKYGYKIDESNATVNEVINSSLDLAFVTLTAKNKTSSKQIYSIVDVKKGQVTVMTDNTVCYACQAVALLAVGLGVSVTCALTVMPYCLALGPLGSVLCGAIVAFVCSAAGIFAITTEGAWQVCHDHGWGC